MTTGNQATESNGQTTALAVDRDRELREKFLGLASQLSTQLVERDQVINGMLCAALAGEHVLLLGPPGTAKSALANAFTASVDGATCFSWLLTKYSVPEELFGPPSIKAIKQDCYRRITTGKLPEAEVAFLDEIFKSNSGILNALLSVINERVFHNDGPKKIPLRMVVGASNELPEGPELEALYDRFLVRYWVDYLQQPQSFLGVLMAADPEGKAQLTLAEWDEARDRVDKVEFPLEAAQTLYKLRQALAQQSITNSDRRWKRCVSLVKANAWMSGDKVVQDDHLGLLGDALWSDPEQRETVAKEVGKFAVSVVTDASKMLAAFEAKIASSDLEQLIQDGSEESQRKLVTIHKEARRARDRFQEFSSKARNSRQREELSKMGERLNELVQRVAETTRQGLGL